MFHDSHEKSSFVRLGVMPLVSVMLHSARSVATAGCRSAGLDDSALQKCTIDAGALSTQAEAAAARQAEAAAARQASDGATRQPSGGSAADAARPQPTTPKSPSAAPPAGAVLWSLVETLQHKQIPTQVC